MKPFQACSQAELSCVEMVFFDIDDTFSGGIPGNHRITSEAYQALWQMRKSGIFLVPVTGRPAGWCDMIARMWPVDAVVGENGAFYAHLNEKNVLNKKYLVGPRMRKANHAKLLSLKRKLLQRFTNLRFASDQFCREFDLAIDYCEDVKPWSQSKIQEVMEFCSEQGATVKLSSIHINTWYGRYDKWSCIKSLLKNFFKSSEREIKNSIKIVYLGDSPNDEPFFKQLPFTIGVSNLIHFQNQLNHLPRYITKNPGGLGFAEFVEKLLIAKNSK